MNIWNLSGEILKHGIKGTQYPMLWMLVRLPSPTGFNLQDNKVFVNVDIPTGNSKMVRVADYVKSKLKEFQDKSLFVCLADVSVVPIKVGKKKDDGTWENEEVTGLKAKLGNLYLSEARYPTMNTGFIMGNVSHELKVEAGYKLIVQDRYRNVSTNEWKTRPAPIYYPFNNSHKTDTSYQGKNALVNGSICGQTPEGESKIYIWANQVTSL